MNLYFIYAMRVAVFLTVILSCYRYRKEKLALIIVYITLIYWITLLLHNIGEISVVESPKIHSIFYALPILFALLVGRVRRCLSILFYDVLLLSTCATISYVSFVAQF